MTDHQGRSRPRPSFGTAQAIPQTPEDTHFATDHPDQSASNPVADPVTPDVQPDHSPDEKPEEGATIDPAVSRSNEEVPDGWITRGHAHERLTSAGIEIDSRRVRTLCSRGILKNVKARNEKNQPQYFIDPKSVDEYIAKNGDTVSSDIDPATPDVKPDHSPDQQPEEGATLDPVVSGSTVSLPDQKASEAGERREIDLLQSQLTQAHEEIAFLRDEVKDNRQLKRDMRAISDKMLETFSNVALGGRILKDAPEQEQPPPVDYEQ